MLFTTVTTPGLAVNTYVVGDETTKKMAVIDPVRDVEPILEHAQKNGMTISDILETHVHADFISGAKELKARLNGSATIHCSEMGGEKWLPAYTDRPVKNGDTILLGTITLQAVHTPGHTPEHLTWALIDSARDSKDPVILFTGDCLFVGDVGRPDLLGPGEQEKLAQDLYKSIFKTLEQFPDFTEIYPAHGAGSLCGKAIGARNHSTMGYERLNNPALQALSLNNWVSQLMQDMPKAPPYFKHMKELNVTGAPIIGSDHKQIDKLNADVCRKQMDKGAFILDTRSKENYAALHLPGALNIPLNPVLANWAGWLMPYDKELIFVTENDDDIDKVLIQLRRIGFDNIFGFLNGGIKSWEEAGYPIECLQLLAAEELHRQLQTDNTPFILDVRSKQEWDSSHIKGACHIPLESVEAERSKIPKDQFIATICASGNRASIAASLLQRDGYQLIGNVLGGMNAWQEKRFPITKD